MFGEVVRTTDGNADGAFRMTLSLPLVGWVSRLFEFMIVLLASNVVTMFPGFEIPPHYAADYGRLTLLAALMYLVIAEALGVNDLEFQFSLGKSWQRVLLAWIATALLMTTLGFFLKVSEEYSRAWVSAFLLSGGAGLVATRVLFTLLTRQMKRQGIFNQRAAIYGAGAQAARLKDYVLNHDKLTLDLVGIYEDRLRSEGGEGLEISGGIDRLVSDIRAGKVDQVLLALPWSAEQRLREIVERLAITPVRIRLAPDVASYMFSGRPVVLLGELPVLTLFERPISGFDQALKWAEDRVIGILLLVMVAPLMVFVAIAIKLDSRGPVFFRQYREGFNNQAIKVWKFRSMYTDTCEADGIVQAKRSDPRVTRVGAFIRRTSLDELPQLFNVLGGSMSLVGPRPHAPSTRAGGRLFSEIVATYAARHNVKPGMTGWAQVNGLRGETNTEEDLIRRLRHDLQYVEQWSIWFDFYILFRTATTVLVHRTAY